MLTFCHWCLPNHVPFFKNDTRRNSRGVHIHMLIIHYIHCIQILLCGDVVIYRFFKGIFPFTAISAFFINILLQMQYLFTWLIHSYHSIVTCDRIDTNCMRKTKNRRVMGLKGTTRKSQRGR